MQKQCTHGVLTLSFVATKLRRRDHARTGNHTRISRPELRIYSRQTARRIGCHGLRWQPRLPKPDGIEQVTWRTYLHSASDQTMRQTSWQSEAFKRSTS